MRRSGHACNCASDGTRIVILEQRIVPVVRRGQGSAYGQRRSRCMIQRPLPG